jgi:protein-tyrosine-phosphatase
MRNKTNKKFRKLKKTKKQMKKRRFKKNYKKTQKKGGVKDLIKILLLGSIAMSVESGDNEYINKYIMAVCAGNTCRSTMAQEQLIKILGTENYNIFSRGVAVRNPGAAMAPLSEAFSVATCEGDQACITRVKEHISTQFDCEEVVKILRANLNATFLIIPMDDNVADSIEKLMSLCDMTDAERSRVSVGFCDEKSANVQDPFFDKNQPTEGNAYSNAANQIYHSFYDVFGTECKIDKWEDTTDKFGAPMISNKPFQNSWPGYTPDKVPKYYREYNIKPS